MIFNYLVEEVPNENKNLNHMTDFRKNTFFPGKGIPDPTAFFFRLNNKTLFYTAFENDLEILGAIQINEINHIDL